MATRTIVTSQPDVECDVCERRLLRGEHHDIFLAAGRRRTVCELCAPRAAHEGWMRERDSASVTLPPMRPRRGRSFLERLPVPFRVRQVGSEKGAAAPGRESVEGRGRDGIEAEGPSDYDFLDGYDRPRAQRATATSSGGAQAPAPTVAGGDSPAATEPGLPAEQGGEGASYLTQALEVFNTSEYPRRVAGVARSLGEPQVSVRSAEHLASVVVIVVAWELSWYRYEVDLSEELPSARVSAQGTELSELEREERLANALASEAGMLALARI